MDDQAIVQLYWARNERAIEQTAVKYGSYCTHIAVNILNNHEDAGFFRCKAGGTANGNPQAHTDRLQSY